MDLQKSEKCQCYPPSISSINPCLGKLKLNLLELDLSSTMLTGSVLTTVNTVGVEFWLTTVSPWPPEDVMMCPLLVIICELGAKMWLWGAKICPEGKICALFIIWGWY